MDIFLGHKSREHCSVGTFFLTIRLNSGVWGKYRGQIILDIITGKLFPLDSSRTYLTVMENLNELYLFRYKTARL